MSQSELTGKATEFDQVAALLLDPDEEVSLQARVAGLVLSGWQVVELWEHGDLAGAVRSLNLHLQSFKNPEAIRGML